MNFDEIIDRRDTASLKWDKYGKQDILPMWVADMDFAAPKEVTEALQRAINHRVYGYTLASEDLTQTIVDRMEKLYDWSIKSEDIVFLPGVVCALNIACRTVGQSGDEVLMSSPVYPPFLSAPYLSDRKTRSIMLKENHQNWQIDFDAIAEAINEKSKLYLLCQPHNPVGRVYTREELSKLTDLCLENEMIICSDEIHCDLILDKKKQKTYRPTATLSEKVAQSCITLMAPSKTFNLPGLACSFAIIQNSSLRRRFTKIMRGIVPHVNSLGYVACQAAYSESEKWHEALLDYLRANRDYISTYLTEHCPQVKMAPVEATYLAWFDISSLNLENPIAHFESFGLGLSGGSDFGLASHVRLNFACPRKTLEEGLRRFANAVQSPLISR